MDDVIYLYLIKSCFTGAGKSLIFHLGGLLLKMKHGYAKAVTLVVAPLNAIIDDQMLALTNKGQTTCKIDIMGNASKSTHLKDLVSSI